MKRPDLVQEILGRPLVPITLALVLGLASGVEPKLLICSLLLIPFFRRGVLMVLIFVALGVGIALAPRLPSKLIQEQTTIRGEGRVIVAPRPSKGGERCVVEENGNRYVFYYKPEQFRLSWGDRIGFAGVVTPLTEQSRLYWEYQGVRGAVRPNEIRVLQSGPAIAQLGQASRLSFVQFSEQNLNTSVASWVNALCFNHDSELTTAEREDLRKSGTIHIVSTSGLHVALLALFLSTALRYLPIPRWMQCCALVILVLLFAAASGFRPPMIRSLFMIMPAVFAYLFRREADGISIVCFSAIATLLWSPQSVWDIGFQLSFVSVLGLVLFMSTDHPPMSSAWEVLRFNGMQLVKSSFVATMFSLPLLAYHFGQFSLIGIVSNLFVVPVLPCLTLTALGAWMISGIAPGLANFLMVGVVQPLTQWMQWVIQVFGNLPTGAFEVQKFSPWWLLLVYGLMISLWRPTRRAPEAVGAAIS